MAGKKRPKSYASRTCRSCREAKRRCNMPTSSLRELPSVNGVDPCSRCKKLQLVCILDDFGKRRKIEYKRKHEHYGLEVDPQTDERLGSRLLLLELRRQAGIVSGASKQAAQVKAASIDDLDLLVGEDLCQTLSRWSHNELRLWFPSLKPAHHLRALRRRSSSSSPALIIQEAGQYLIAALHRSDMLGDDAQKVIDMTEPLIKTSLAELMLASFHNIDALLALQLVSFFQSPGSLSLALLSASTRAARLAMVSSSSSAYKLAWCSASVWEACIALGMQNGLELFRPEECPSLAFVEELSASIDQDDVGVRCILFRARNLAHLCEAWHGVSIPASMDAALTHFNAASLKVLWMVEELDPSQQAFVRLEVDIGNTLVQGRALATALGDDLFSSVSFLSQSVEMRSFINQRNHLAGLVSQEERMPASQDSYKEAAGALISMLFDVEASKGAVLTTPDATAAPLPPLHGLGYLYEAACSLFRSRAPYLHWMSRQKCSLSMQSVKRLVQSVLATEQEHAHLDMLCAQIELDFILDDPILSN